jgi:hypothetical protein
MIYKKEKKKMKERKKKSQYIIANIYNIYIRQYIQ